MWTKQSLIHYPYNTCKLQIMARPIKKMKFRTASTIANESSKERKKQNKTCIYALHLPANISYTIPPPRIQLDLFQSRHHRPYTPRQRFQPCEGLEPRSGPSVTKRKKKWATKRGAAIVENKGGQSVGELSRGFDSTRITAIPKTRGGCVQWVYFKKI